jgi:hypothetical protein
MNVSALYDSSSVAGLTKLYQTQTIGSLSSGSTEASGTVTGTNSQSDSVDISKPAEMFAKLQQLAQTDPEKLKKLCADIAEKLKSAAEKQTGRGASMLSDLAEKFQNVADGGDVSQLQPPPPPPTSAGGVQGAIDKYSQQQGTGPNSDIMKLMDSIFAEVESATA